MLTYSTRPLEPLLFFPLKKIFYASALIYRTLAADFLPVFLHDKGRTAKKYIVLMLSCYY